MMSHFSDLSDITLNMYYINSSNYLNTLVIISVPVDTASLSLLYLQSSCAKNFINRMLFNDDIHCV